MKSYPCYWNWLVKLGDRKNHPCKILARGKMNSILIEFTDGYRVVTSRNAVRRRWCKLKINQ